ncbi:MAG: hypothetical protein Q4D89_06075 [Arachnia propionica]|uniref:hypothetical protein n=1 Tax=Arachnia propionica TaxID=1750 RepID=UPI0026FF6818|nr:hypothetical protein [Arachnia propionica]
MDNMNPNTVQLQEELGHIADQIEEAGHQMNLLAGKGFSGEIVSVVRNWISSKERSLNDRGFTLAYRLAPNELPDLVPDILNWIDSDRYHPQTFHLLGMLSRAELQRILVPEVFRRLSEDTSLDYYMWWRFACLFSHLGLEREVGRVAALALTHPNPEVREMGQDMVTDLYD